MIRLAVLLALFFISYTKVYSQKIYAIPQYWYKNSIDSSLQLYIHLKEIRDSKVNLLSDIIRITKRNSNTDKNSLKLDLIVPSSFEANFIPFEFQIKKKKQSYNYLLVDPPKIKTEKIESDSFVLFINTSIVKNAIQKNNLILNLIKARSQYYININTLKEIKKDTDSIIILELDDKVLIENIVSLDKILKSEKMYVINLGLSSNNQKQDYFYHNLLLQQTLYWFLNQKIAAVAINKSTENFSELSKYFGATQ